MTSSLSTEAYWLLLTILFTAILWVPYIINRIVELGLVDALMDPYGHTKANAAWANRMMAAHVNAVENLVLFAPLVVLLLVYEVSTPLTVLAVQLYFYARVLHVILFTFAVPLLRIISFLAGFVAQMLLIYALLT